MENQSAVDTRLWTALRGVHADFGTRGPNVEFSQCVSTCRNWSAVFDQSTTYISDKLERLGSTRAGELECAVGATYTRRWGGHRDPTQHLAGQSPYRIDPICRLSARKCGDKWGSCLWISDHANRVAAGVQHRGCEC